MSDRQIVRDQISIADALEMLDLEQPNAQDKICCPFHEETTPSFHVYEDHAMCYGCGWNGDVVWFVAQLTGQPIWRAEQFLLGQVDDVEAPARVAPKVREVRDLTRVFHEAPHAGKWTVSDLALPLVKKRWPYLLLSDIASKGVKVARDGLWIPHYDDDHRVVGIKIRHYNGSRSSVPGSTFRLPYRPELRDDCGSVVLCEGEPDTWAMLKATPITIDVVGLPSGTQTYTDEVHEYLCRFHRVCLALDLDDAGREATRKIMVRLSARTTYNVADIAGLMEGYGTDVCDALHAGWKPGFD